MLFDENFLEFIKEKPVEGVLELCEITRKNLVLGNNWTKRDYEVLLEALALISCLDEMGLISRTYSIPTIDGVLSRDCDAVNRYLLAIGELYKAEESKLKLQNLKAHYSINLGGAFSYEFSQGDLDRVQVLINELREYVSKSLGFEEKHKQRVLSRLEKLQTELHKKVSDLDRLWGLVGDAGVAIGKFGEDSKPIVDRIREITEIVWRTQARAEELPSGSPLPELEDKTGTTGD